MKQKVREKKFMVDERWSDSLSRNFREKKLLWKEVNVERKSNDQMERKIRNVVGHMLTVGEDVIGRFRSYFEELLNVDDGREAQLSGERIPGVNQNARHMLEVSVEDVRKAVKKIKNGKAPGVDGITSEMLKYGGESVIEWLTKVCNVCFREGRVPKVWQRAIVVPFYKGKGDKMECKNYRGKRFLSIPGKVHGSVLIERVHEMTEGLIREE